MRCPTPAPTILFNYSLVINLSFMTRSLTYKMLLKKHCLLDNDVPWYIDTCGIVVNIGLVSRTVFPKFAFYAQIPLMDLTVLANTAVKPTFLYATLANIFHFCSTPVNSFLPSSADMQLIVAPQYLKFQAVGLYISFPVIFSKDFF